MGLNISGISSEGGLGLWGFGVKGYRDSQMSSNLKFSIIQKISMCTRYDYGMNDKFDEL